MKFFTLLLVIYSSFLFAQESEIYSNGVFAFEENSTQKIFTDATRVRQFPDLNAPILDSLDTNQIITIKAETDKVLKLGEKIANWYSITYEKNNVRSVGYVWGGNLCIGFHNRSGKDFLFGIIRTEKKFDNVYHQEYLQNIASVKVMNAKELLTEQSFETGSGESLSYGTFSIENNKGLKNVEFIIKALVSGEACGIPSYEQYLLYSKGKLVALPQLMSVADADVFYHSENYFFPTDKGGKSGLIIYNMEEMEKDENEKETKKNDKKTYTWNGEKIKLLK